MSESQTQTELKSRFSGKTLKEQSRSTRQKQPELERPWPLILTRKQTCRKAACSRCGGKQLCWKLKAGMQRDMLYLIDRAFKRCSQVPLPIAETYLAFIFTLFPHLCSLNLFSTLLACGVLMMCTVLGLTPLALVLLYRANLLFRLPRSPLGREPLYLLQRGWENSHS